MIALKSLTPAQARDIADTTRMLNEKYPSPPSPFSLRDLPEADWTPLEEKIEKLSLGARQELTALMLYGRGGFGTFAEALEYMRPFPDNPDYILGKAGLLHRYLNDGLAKLREEQAPTRGV
jgi:Protein of unknown function (DUF3775)